MPISSIQATIAKLSIRPPSATDPAMEQAEEPVFLPDLDSLGTDIQLFQDADPPTDTQPPSSFSPPLSSPAHSPPPPNGLDIVSPSPPAEAVPQRQLPPARLLCSFVPGAFGLDDARGLLHGGRGPGEAAGDQAELPAAGGGSGSPRDSGGHRGRPARLPGPPLEPQQAMSPRVAAFLSLYHQASLEACRPFQSCFEEKTKQAESWEKFC